MNAFFRVALLGAGLAVSLSIAAPGSGMASRPRAAARQVSLLVVANTQLTQARVRMPGAQLFEVHTAIRPQDIAAGVALLPFVYSDFALPGNDVTYLSVSTSFTDLGQHTQIAGNVSFVSAACTGAAHPNCGSATGKPEPRARHMPLAGWKIDMSQLMRILKANHYVSDGYSEITVTTAGRAAATISGPVARLAALRLPQPVILVREATAPRYHFIFVNATTGLVIDKGVAVAPPLPA